MSIAAVSNIAHNPKTSTERRKSVVVSNVASNISAEYLQNYLSVENSVDKQAIRVTPLGNNNPKISSLQYRISAPECHYTAVKTSSTWPKDVRVRDFVYKSRRDGVSMNNFLVKEKASRQRNQIASDQPPTNDLTTQTSGKTAHMDQMD